MGLIMMMTTMMTILLRFILDLRSPSSPCAVFFLFLFLYIFHVTILGLWKVFGDVLMHLMSRYERFHLGEVDFLEDMVE